MTSRLLTLRDAIIARIADALPANWEVASHLGRFDAAALKAFIVKAPAVRVAILGLDQAKALDDDALTVRVRIGVYVVTRDQGAQLARETLASAAVETIVLLALGQRWSQTFVQPAEPATAQVIHSDATLAAGVALWAIDIPQTLILERPEGEAWPIRELWLGIAPEIGAAHVADYVGPFPSPSPSSDAGGEDE